MKRLGTVEWPAEPISARLEKFSPGAKAPLIRCLYVRAKSPYLPPKGSCRGAILSVRHAVQDVIEADAKGHGREGLGIIRIVRPFPCVAQVHVVADRDHDAPLLVPDSAPFRLIAVFLIGAAAPNVL